MTDSNSTTPDRHPQARLYWLYLLAAVPILTERIETGRLPGSPREWITEVVAGAVIAALVRKVRADHLALLALSRSDMLTGLWNRRAFEQAIADECARARRSGRPLSLVYIDLDNFKLVNDREGHQQGDRMLQHLAAAIRHVVRVRVDRGFRIGGDEFALILPGSAAGQANAVVQRIRTRCAEADPAWVNGLLGISAGIVELEAGEDAEAFVRRADEAMYRTKRARRRQEARA